MTKPSIREVYLTRYAVDNLIDQMPYDLSGADICIVIPCYKEDKLLQTLHSILECQSIKLRVEILIVVNFHETDSKEIIELSNSNYLEACDFAEKHNSDFLRFLPLKTSFLPKKWAGVGLARKIGLDLAFSKGDKPEGLLVCLDSDCTVANNYLESLERFYFQSHLHGASIYFEHPLSNPGIVQYELFLRYFIEAQRWCGLPYGYQTVGSSMLTRNRVYARVGGMNKRKAGEDFYFLQKIIQSGPFVDITDTTVFPSDRKSDRVPFGTGKAMNDYNENRKLRTYPFEIFVGLKKWINSIDDFYEGKDDLEGIEAEYLLTYLKENDFIKEMDRIRSNSSSIKAFRKHFFNWFDAFRLMKFCNKTVEEWPYAIDNTQEAKKAYSLIFSTEHLPDDPIDLLEKYRMKAKRTVYLQNL